MRAARLLGRGLFLAGAAIFMTTPVPAALQRTAAPPRLEAVAETRLLMEALNQSNFRGLERLLRTKPTDVESWGFIRGQALLIAETGNLLLLRPPRNSGEETWQSQATDLRQAATALARAAGNRDFDRCRVGIAAVANVCNRCHQTFRVPVRMAPFAEAPDRTEE
jgi:Cytochrome C'